MAADSAGSVSMSLKMDKGDFKSQLKSIVGEAVAEVKKEVSSQTSSMTKSVVSAQKSITSTTKAATNQITSEVGALSSLTKVAKGLLGALGIAVSIAGILSFGKACVDLGSDLQEVQNVVQVTFGEMEDSVNEFARSAIKNYGISETAAKNYMGTLGAMSQAFGFSQAEAYEQAEALTALAGDMASFYNKSTDETYNALRAVYSGETEVLKQYGVVMTETALNEFALARGMGKTISQMSEQEKVSLRLAFVQDRLSASVGDFQRTQDGWANQTRVLSLQWESFKATIGQGLINVLTPIVQWLNAIMEAAQGAAQAFADFTATIMGVTPDLGGVADATAAAAQSAQDINSGITAAGGSAKKAVKQLAGFDKLNILSKQSSGGGGGGSKTSSVSPVSINKATLAENGLNESLSRTRELLSDIRDAFREGFGSTYNGKYIDDIREDISSIGATVRRIFSDPDVQGAAENCTRSWARAFGAVTGTVATITTGVTKTVTGSIDKFLTDNEEPIREHLVTMFDLSSREADAVTKLSTSVSNIFQKVFDSGNLEKAGGNILGSIFDVSSVLSEITQAIPTGFLEGLAESFSEYEEDISTACVNITGAISTFTGQIKEKLDIVRQYFDSSGIADKARSIGETIGSIIGVLAQGFNKMFPIIKPVWNLIGDIISKDLAGHFSGLVLALNVVLSILKAIATAIKGVVEISVGLTTFDWDMLSQGFEDVFGTIPDLMVDLAEDLGDFFYEISEIFDFSGVVQGIKDAWNGVSSWFSQTVIEPIKSFFTDLWDKIKNVWNTAAKWFDDHVIQPIVNFFSPIVDTVSTFFNDLWWVIVGIWIIASTWFYNTVIQPIVNLFNTFKTIVSNVFSTLWTTIQNIWSVVSSWFDSNIIQPVVGLFNGFKSTVSSVFSTLWTAIQNIWSVVAGWFTNNVSQPVTTTFSNLKTRVSGFFSSLWAGIKSIWNQASGWFKNNVIDPIVSAFNGLKSSVIGIFNGVIGAVEGMINHIIDGINSFINGVNSIGAAAAAVAGGDFTGFSTFGHVSLPRLAGGAFVEANTPQLAVIGDNRHQGEFVAPEDKLQAAVASAMMAMMPQIAMAMANAMSRTNVGNSGEITIHNHIDLDGDAIYDNQEKVRRRREKRSGGN